MQKRTSPLMEPHEMQKLLGPEFLEELISQTQEDIRLGRHHLRNPRSCTEIDKG